MIYALLYIYFIHIQNAKDNLLPMYIYLSMYIYLLEGIMKKHSADFRELYRDDVFALLCVLSFSATMIVGTEEIAGIVLTGVLDVLALARGIMAVYGRCRPVPRKASGAVWTAALFFTALAVIWVVMKVKDRH